MQFPARRISVTVEAKTHREVPVLGLVIKWVMIDYPHTCVWLLRVDLTDVSNVVGTCDLCRVYNYSNSRVRGHGQLVSHTVP